MKEETDPCKCHAVYCTAAHHCQRVHQRRRRPLGRLHNRTDEDNADAHMTGEFMGREVVVAVTNSPVPVVFDVGPLLAYTGFHELRSAPWVA